LVIVGVAALCLWWLQSILYSAVGLVLLILPNEFLSGYARLADASFWIGLLLVGWGVVRAEFTGGMPRLLPTALFAVLCGQAVVAFISLIAFGGLVLWDFVDPSTLDFPVMWSHLVAALISAAAVLCAPVLVARAPRLLLAVLVFVVLSPWILAPLYPTMRDIYAAAHLDQPAVLALLEAAEAGDPEAIATLETGFTVSEDGHILPPRTGMTVGELRADNPDGVEFYPGMADDEWVEFDNSGGSVRMIGSSQYVNYLALGMLLLLLRRGRAAAPPEASA
jgi:hypothetical protein